MPQQQPPAPSTPAWTPPTNLPSAKGQLNDPNFWINMLRISGWVAAGAFVLYGLFDFIGSVVNGYISGGTALAYFFRMLESWASGFIYLTVAFVLSFIAEKVLKDKSEDKE
jgi:hypothetical protein